MNLTRIRQLIHLKSIALYILFCLLIPNDVGAQSATQTNISGTNSVITISNNTATVVDPNVVLTANGTITGFTVSITGSYTSGDVLAYTGTLPTGITAAAFNTSTKSLVFSGTTSAANWQALIRTVTLTTTSAVCNPESRAVSYVVGTKYYNNLNGHFYEYYGTSTSWTGAKTYIGGLSYFGREAYMATLTSQSENSFVAVLIGQNSWIGCSDNMAQVNAALGYSLYGSQTAADGNFYWITGPERGTKISSQNAWASGGVMPVSGVYNNWTSGEPNDYPNNGTVGEEDYGHMYTSSFLWNDFPNSSSIGSIIEYGGMPNDIVTSQVVFTRNIYINGAPSGTITGGNVSVCSGSNSTLLTLTGLTGTVVRWESSTDNFISPATTIVNTAFSYTVTNISTNTYYRAIVNTSGGCTALATSGTGIMVNTTVAGNIVAANNTICSGSAASFTLFGNTGSVNKWQYSTTSTFTPATTTDIINTTTAMSYILASTGTYYFRAVVQNSGCGSPVNTPGYSISVITGTSPVGGLLTHTEHCGGTSNTGTIILSGYTGTVQKWQYSTDGGIIWTDVTNTTASLTYTGISANRIYRAILINGSCGTAYSAQGTVTVYGTTVTRWDGATSGAWQTASNWCGGVADNGIDVVIKSTAANHLVLDQSRIIGNLNFNGSGRYITIGNFMITTASISNSTSSSYVKTNGSGVLKTNIPNNSSATFPVGDAAYNSVTITNKTGSADYFSVRVLNEVFNDGTTGYTNKDGRVKRTWDISKTNPNGGSGLNFVFNWNSGEDWNLTTPTLYHYENGVWNKQTGTTTSTSSSLNYTGYTGTFSPFSIGNNIVPLPVNMMQFDVKARISSHSVQLTWQTASEENNHYFEIMRSPDGQNWQSIGRVEGHGTSNTPNQYEFIDLRPDPVNYYRLKQVDFEGKNILNVTKRADMNMPADDLVKIYPNPSWGMVDIITAEPATYKIIDMNGRTVAEGEVSSKVQLNNLDAGVYMVNIAMGETIYNVKLLIK